MTPDTNKERAEFEAWANGKGYDIAGTYDTDRSRWVWLNPMTADLWDAWQARASLAAKAPAAPTGWYALAADGMATLCVDRDDAAKEAANSEKKWPHLGPYRAVQLYTAPPAPTEQWMPIETAPKSGRQMFVVKGFAVTNENCGVHAYTTDPYCVWPGDDGGWVRWPHSFPPTHWHPLPAPPQGAAKKDES